ncbi:MAG: outer membrane protein assembly factor BamD [Alphaproteobacteria bacterium]|nr:outer membrane protein assembly factor BamD [Alphaproteobacteria bacterium]
MLKKVVMVLGLALLTVACDPLDEYRNKSDAYLYDTGMDYLEYGRHERAAKVFEEVDLQHPSSPLAPKALLMAGYCYYLESNPDSRNTNRFPDALDKFESFVRLHPNHEMIPYALYMMGMCHFEMLGDEMRDQTASAKAVGYFSNVIERFPNSPYAKDASEKLKILVQYAAKKHVYIAEVLMQEERYAPAIERLQQALKMGLDEESKRQAFKMINDCYVALKLNHLVISENKEASVKP